MFRRGRPIKLNQKVLKPLKGKPYAEVLFFGDLHYGHPTCLLKEAKKMLDYCLKKKIYVMIMGDLVECGITGSVGDSVYAQKLDPQSQMDAVIELLTPLAEAGLILGLHEGNHENRIYKTAGINISKVIAGALDVPYMFSACWSIFKVGKNNYTLYSMHGTSGSRFIYTKVKAVTDISHYFDADIVAMGHVHDLATNAIERQRINMRSKTIEFYKQYVLLTGQWLGYQLSYAQMKGYPPSKVGSPKIKLYLDKKDIHVSF